MGEHVVEGVDGEEGGYRHKAVVFAEVAVGEQLVVAEAEVGPGGIVLFYDLFELAVVAAVFVHFVDELRVFDIVLVGVDEPADEVELFEMMVFVTDEEESQNNAEDNGDVGNIHKAYHSPKIFADVAYLVIKAYFSVFFNFSCQGDKG